MENNHLTVSEQFLSIQGEGRTIGKPSYFLRLTACNLMCGGMGTQKDGLLHGGATWRCDSIESWIKGTRKTFESVIEDFGTDFIRNLDHGYHLIITGGEPLIQQESIVGFLAFLCDEYDTYPTVEIETNGTIMPVKDLKDYVQYWNVSPKLSNSGETTARRFRLDVLKYFAENNQAIFKYVISNNMDLTEMMIDATTLGLTPEQIWVMPAGSTREELELTAPQAVEYCKYHGFNYSHRVHISVWDKKTGV